MNITIANIDDLEKFNKIYKEYVLTQYQYIDSETLSLYERFDYNARNKAYLLSDFARILFVKENDEIIGFAEFNIEKSNYFFENDSIYISNLYFSEKLRKNCNEIFIASKIMDEVKNWAKEKNIKYICNDIFYGNNLMKSINKILDFKPYKVRYFKEI